MALENGQLAELADELTDDPKGLGYASMDDPTAAAKLNELGASGESGPVEPVDVDLLNREVTNNPAIDIVKSTADIMPPYTFTLFKEDVLLIK